MHPGNRGRTTCLASMYDHAPALIALEAAVPSFESPHLLNHSVVHHLSMMQPEKSICKDVWTSIFLLSMPVPGA